MSHPAAHAIGAGAADVAVSGAARARAPFAVAGIALAAVAGAALRLFELHSQVLVHDELHLVYAVVKLPLGEIARSWVYEGADYSVPLGLLFRALRDAGVALSEMHFRAPMLLCGIAAVIAIPCAVRAHIGSRAAVVLAWLLATSPLLVYYSRIVRSYMPLALVAFAAVWFGLRWIERRDARVGAAYVACAALAIYLHLVAAPFVLAPMLLWLDDLASSRSAAAARRDAALAIALAAVVVALLWPARESILWVMQNRRIEPEALAPGVGGALSFLAGLPPRPGMVLFFALLVRGLWTGFASERRFHARLFTVGAAHVAAVFALSPQQMSEAPVFARYCLVLVPLALLWVALGLTAPWNVGPARLRRAGPLAVGVVFAWCVVGQGILVTGGLRTPSFGNWSFFQRRDAPVAWAPESVPAFYRELANASEAGALLEAPWHHLIFTRMLAAHQRVHGRRVLVSYPSAYAVNDPALRLRNTVRPDPTAFLRSRARWLVVHRDPGREERSLDPSGKLPFEAIDARQAERALRIFASWTSNLYAYATEHWGPPVYADERIYVWDLAALRAADAEILPAARP